MVAREGMDEDSVVCRGVEKLERKVRDEAGAWYLPGRT
jgi:hypothetical protein